MIIEQRDILEEAIYESIGGGNGELGEPVEPYYDQVPVESADVLEAEARM